MFQITVQYEKFLETKPSDTLNGYKGKKVEKLVPPKHLLDEPRECAFMSGCPHRS